MAGELRPPTGHVFRVGRARGPVWYAKYRLPDGRQVQKKLGPAWTDRGRPATGQFTKRLAENWLRDVLDQARRGTPPGMVRTGATFADAAAEYLRYVEHDRGRKPSTVRGYQSAIEAHLLPALGSMAIEDVTAEAIERWLAGFEGSPRTRNKLLIELHGILARAKKVYGLQGNAAAEDTNAIEALNRQLRKAIKTKGSFPSEDAARKLVYLALQNATPQWTRTQNWTTALLAFKIAFGDRVPDIAG